MTRGGVILGGVALAAVGLVALAVSLGSDRLVVLRAWLVAAHFWTGVSLGAAVLLLIHAVTGGRWGEALGPALRAGARTMPLCVLAWLPLVAAAGELFPWAGEPPEALHPVVARKLAYLDIGFLQVRSVVILALFVGVAWASGAWSRRAPSIGLSSAGLMVFALALTLFTVDWAMAFEPTFYSSVYPVLHGAGAVAAALAVASLFLWAGGGSVDRLRDCGMLMLAWSMVWAYLAFMQYLIIWSGDLPHEIEWYLVRIEHGWRPVAWLSILCHVGVVAAMSSPALKSRPNAVAAAALVLLGGQAADLWWRTAPVFERDGGLAVALDLAATASLGALWTATALLAGGGRQGREAARG